MKEYPAKELVDVKIISDAVNINVEKLTRPTALALVEGILRDHPADAWLQENLPPCLKCFGFTGRSQGQRTIRIHSYMPRVVLNEKHTCPRRINEIGPWEYKEAIDTWEMRGDDKCCSFCGSLHPDRVVELVKEFGLGIIQNSTKSYKWYINRASVPNASYGGIKYYRMHDTDEFITKMNEFFFARDVIVTSSAQ